MFRRDVQSISDLLNMYLRREGLETPLLQKRAVDAWDTLMGYIRRLWRPRHSLSSQVLFACSGYGEDAIASYFLHYKKVQYVMPATFT